MRVLFDQGTPVPLRPLLAPHDVQTAFELGWSTLVNGELLDRAEAADVQVLVTTDQSLRHPQSLVGRAIAIVALSSTSWPRIRPMAAEIRRAIDESTPGTCTDVVIPY